MKQRLYIMMGTPGSGKSTYAKRFLWENDPMCLYVSRDSIRFKYVAENEQYFSKEKEVFKEYVKMINTGLANGYNVVADATHLNFPSRSKLLKHLEFDPTKVEVVIVWLQTSLEDCLKRNENRAGTRSYVPPDQILKMNAATSAPSQEEFHILRIVTEMGVEKEVKGKFNYGLFHVRSPHRT